MHSPRKARGGVLASLSQYRAAVVAALAVAVALQFYREVVTAVAFTGALTETWEYHASPWYLSYLQREWSRLPEVAATPMPEIDASDFSQELFWQITDNLRKPVVIRGAVKNSTAFKHWGRDFFIEHYPDELVLVRESLGPTDFRIEQIPVRDFWAAYEQGKNVTIFTSSSIFHSRPELFNEAATPFEDQLRDKEGHGIFLSQLFITPGSRSFYHAEVGGNIFRQIAGRKAWTLISPEHNRWLCPVLVGEFVAVQSCVQGFEPELREQWFRRIPRLTTELEPGDIIYNPPWYWHDIVTLDDNTRQTSLAGRVTLRTQSLQNSLFQSLLILRRQLGLRKKIRARAAEQGLEVSEHANKLFEDFIAEEWIAGCIAEGRDDCESRLRLASRH